MDGKDDGSGGDLHEWLEKQRREMDSIRREFQDGFDKEVRRWKDDTHSLKGPFERFKSFIDSNFGTFSQGFRNFPSNVSELKTKMQQEREARRQEELDIWRRWTGSEDSPDHIKLQVERQSSDDREAVRDATYMLLREAYERNKHVPPSKILQLYKDNESNFGALDRFATPMLSMGGACFYKPETVENLPSTAGWTRWSTPSPQWLSVDWFKRSPYSPMRLEAHPGLEDSCWRAAFEDLLCSALDKPMVSEEKVGQRIPYGKPQSTYRGPGLDWMLSLQCRGILPPQLPSLYKPVSLFDGFDEVKRPRTIEFMHDLDQIMSKDKTTRMYPLVKRDLDLLMDEIAIKSGPATEARPLRVVPQSPWRVPETEQELYEDMPPYTDLAEPILRVSEQPKVTGDRADDRTTFERAFWDAIHEDNVEGAMDHFHAYEQYYDNALALIENRMESEPLVASVLITALPMLRESWKEGKRKAMEDDLEVTENLQVPPVEGRKGPARSTDRVNESITTAEPRILSHLTTTRTVRMPDGTVTSKLVLKKRFADGTEETHEVEQTTQEDGKSTNYNSPEQKKVDEQPKKQKGWFWN